MFAELTTLEECERRRYLKYQLLSCNVPSDIWDYLINGSLYDPGSVGPVGKRFKCQQCAYAWWMYFGYIARQAKKEIWAVIGDEIALCSPMDREETGAWRSGFWSDCMGIHSRLQFDGLHLLISQYELTGSSYWLDAAKLGMRFVSEHPTEVLDVR